MDKIKSISRTEQRKKREKCKNVKTKREREREESYEEKGAKEKNREREMFQFLIFKTADFAGERQFEMPLLSKRSVLSPSKPLTIFSTNLTGDCGLESGKRDATS